MAKANDSPSVSSSFAMSMLIARFAFIRNLDQPIVQRLLNFKLNNRFLALELSKFISYFGYIKYDVVTHITTFFLSPSFMGQKKSCIGFNFRQFCKEKLPHLTKLCLRLGNNFAHNFGKFSQGIVAIFERAMHCHFHSKHCAKHHNNVTGSLQFVCSWQETVKCQMLKVVAM